MLSLCLHFSSLNLCHLISVMDVILFGLDYVINSVLVYLHFPHVLYLLISLNWYFVIWRFKRSRVFYTHFEHSYFFFFTCIFHTYSYVFVKCYKNIQVDSVVLLSTLATNR